MKVNSNLSKIIFVALISVFYVLPLAAQKDTVKSKDRPGNHSQSPDGKGKPSLRYLLDELRADLEDLDELVSQKLSGRDKKKALGILDHALDMTDDIEEMLPGHGGHGGGYYNGLPLIPEAAFNEIIIALEKESFSSAKMSIIEISSLNASFSINQIIAVVAEFTMRDDKINVVRKLYPTSADKYNAFKLVNAFTFNSDKEEVTKIITQNK